MAKQTINPGTAPTGAGGDTFRSGSAKLQANDNELYDFIGGAANTTTLPSALPIAKGGTGATTAAAARTNLGLGTAATATLTVNDEDSTKGRVVRVGDFGISIPYTASPDSAASKRSKGCFIRLMDNVNNIVTAGDYPVATTPQFLQQIAAVSTAERSHCVQISYTNTGEIYIRAAGFGLEFSSWFKIFSQKNTTVDANGFIKAASPIVKVFADKIELNDEARQQEISFEKLGVGDYLIKDSSGFAQESWYIETPKDANGNVLFSVIYTTLKNGDISVKTYKKKFDLETASIVADLDNPVDITENRWIDLRLQELPQPEIEEPESVAPPDFQPTGLAQAVATVMESYHGPEQ